MTFNIPIAPPPVMPMFLVKVNALKLTSKEDMAKGQAVKRSSAEASKSAEDRPVLFSNCESETLTVQVEMLDNLPERFPSQTMPKADETNDAESSDAADE